jgi:hypothetical protein
MKSGTNLTSLLVNWRKKLDVVQHLIPATRSSSVGSAIGTAQSMYNSEDANMSDMVGLIPHPYAQVAFDC